VLVAHPCQEMRTPPLGQERGEHRRLWRTRKPGWWEAIIGQAKPSTPIATLSSAPTSWAAAYGTTGPSSTDRRLANLGLRFPRSGRRLVQLHGLLLDALGIERVERG